MARTQSARDFPTRSFSLRGAIVLFYSWVIVVLVPVRGVAQLLPDTAITPTKTASSGKPAEPKLARGLALARANCIACHIFPEPDLLDKTTWRQQTLVRMMIRMGLSPAHIEKHPEAQLLKAAGIFLTEPMVSPEDWNLIVEYYVNAAPELPLPQDPKPKIEVGLKLFQAEPPKHRRPIPSTTLVKINETTRQIYMGDAETQSIDILNGAGSIIESIQVNNIPVSLVETAKGIYVTAIGHFLPSEEAKAELIFLERGAQGFQSDKTLLKHLPRSTHSELVDLNGDGKLDLLVCIYGNNVGRLAWFENLGQAQYQEHVLIPKSGAVRAEVHDFNGDSFPDIAALMAQESESFVILINNGKGIFSLQTVFQKHPSMGHSYFEMTDFNQDGKLDLIVTNGDNGEYPSPLKKYHGMRIYINRGETQFKEAFFYPLNGAYKAVARDFDRDGDFDIAAISFFPDYAKSPEESFVYLENQGSFKFTASTFPQSVVGRWLTMDVGDLDGDEDIDIVLGSYIHGPSPVPARFARNWEAFGPSVLILRNHLHEPR